MSSVVTEPPLEEEHDHEQQNPVFSCLRRRKRHAQVRLAAAAKIVPERSDAAVQAVVSPPHTHTMQLSKMLYADRTQ